MTHLDAAVRQAYREDPRAAHCLLADYAEWPAQTLRLAETDYHLSGVYWTHFVKRVRDLVKHSCNVLDSKNNNLAPDHNGGWEPPLG